MAIEQGGSGLSTISTAEDGGEQLLPRRAAVLEFLHAHSIARFIFATVFFFLFVIVSAWMWAVNGRMWFLDREYPMWLSKSMMVEACGLGDTVIFGDSRAMAALMPERIGSATNLAIGGSTPIEAYFLAEKAVRCPTHPKRVIMAFAPETFLQAEFYWARAALFRFYSFEQMEEIRQVSQRLGDKVYPSDLAGGVGGWIKNVSYSLSLPSYYFPAMVNALFVGRKDANLIVLDATLRSRGHHLFGNADSDDWPGGDTHVAEFKPTPLISHYFERTIELLREHDIEVLFMVMPVNPASLAGTKPAVRNAYNGYMAAAAAKHANFHLVGELPPMLDDEYFGDPEHLNERGARMWSDYVKSKLDGLRSASD
jgi:hypothetical protein